MSLYIARPASRKNGSLVYNQIVFFKDNLRWVKDYKEKCAVRCGMSESVGYDPDAVISASDDRAWKWFDEKMKRPDVSQSDRSIYVFNQKATDALADCFVDTVFLLDLPRGEDGSDGYHAMYPLHRRDARNPGENHPCIFKHTEGYVIVDERFVDLYRKSNLTGLDFNKKALLLDLSGESTTSSLAGGAPSKEKSGCDGVVSALRDIKSELINER